MHINIHVYNFATYMYLEISWYRLKSQWYKDINNKKSFDIIFIINDMVPNEEQSPRDLTKQPTGKKLSEKYLNLYVLKR